MRYILLALGLLLGLTACGEDEPEPAVQAEQSLERFSEAVDQMEDRAQTLSEEVDELQRQLRDDIEKHLSVLNTRLNDYEERIIALPAEQEAQLRQAYSELIAQVGEVKQLYHQWREAAGEESDRLRTRLNEARAELNAAFERFEARLREAESA